MLNAPIKPRPLPFYKLWGGDKLAKQKGFNPYDDEGRALGEVWEISTLPENETLKSHLDCDELPFLFKLIDTKENLSVQIHPSDEYAKKHEDSRGKSECWLILGAEEEAKIYLGLREGVSHHELKRALEEDEDLSTYLKAYHPKAGDFFSVPAGSIHAIGRGVTLAELQQASSITYRFWDWGRVDKNGVKRELHLRQAFDVLKEKDQAYLVEDVFSKDEVVSLWTTNEFGLEAIKLNPEKEHKEFLSDKKTFLFPLDAGVILTLDGKEHKLIKYESIFLSPPPKKQMITLRSVQKESRCLVIKSW